MTPRSSRTRGGGSRVNCASCASRAWSTFPGSQAESLSPTDPLSPSGRGLGRGASVGLLQGCVQLQLDVALERLRHWATTFCLLSKLLELVLADAAHAPAHGQRRRRDASARDELDLCSGAQPLGFVTGFGKAVGKGHVVTGRVGGRDELLGACLAMLALRPARPRNWQLAECAALGLDVPAPAHQVAFPSRVSSTYRSHAQPPQSPHWGARWKEGQFSSAQLER